MLWLATLRISRLRSENPSTTIGPLLLPLSSEAARCEGRVPPSACSRPWHGTQRAVRTGRISFSNRARCSAASFHRRPGWSAGAPAAIQRFNISMSGIGNRLAINRRRHGVGGHFLPQHALLWRAFHDHRAVLAALQCCARRFAGPAPVSGALWPWQVKQYCVKIGRTSFSNAGSLGLAGGRQTDAARVGYEEESRAFS